MVFSPLQYYCNLTCRVYLLWLPCFDGIFAARAPWPHALAIN